MVNSIIAIVLLTVKAYKTIDQETHQSKSHLAKDFDTKINGKIVTNENEKYFGDELKMLVRSTDAFVSCV